VQNPLDKTFWLWSAKTNIAAKYGIGLFFCFVSMSGFVMRPPRPRNKAFGEREKFLSPWNTVAVFPKISSVAGD